MCIFIMEMPPKGGTYDLRFSIHKLSYFFIFQDNMENSLGVVLCI